MCHVLEVSRSGYYAWEHHVPSRREEEEKRLAPVLRAVFDENKRVYGCVRMSQVLQGMGLSVGKGRMRHLMRLNGLRPVKPKWKPWSISKPDAQKRFSPDLVKRDFYAPGPNILWTTDISWVFTSEGILYLAIILDVFSRYIVGWALGETETAELVLEAFAMARGRREIPRGMIFHSDKGGQFCDDALRSKLTELGISQSMNGKGTWYDNAITESAFATIKKECIYKEDIIGGTKSAAKEKLFEYVELFYNRKRLHSSIGYKAPAEFEKQLTKV
jgi:putative transposase